MAHSKGNVCLWKGNMAHSKGNKCLFNKKSVSRFEQEVKVKQPVPKAPEPFTYEKGLI